jgi:hypothetical protein
MTGSASMRRSDCAIQLRLRQVVKPSRWLLLRNREKIPATQLPRLDELPVASASLLTAYAMHTGRLDGINHRIRMLKRMAYGYRDKA